MKRPVTMFALGTMFAVCYMNTEDKNVIPLDQYKAIQTIHTLPP